MLGGLNEKRATMRKICIPETYATQAYGINNRVPSVSVASAHFRLRNVPSDSKLTLYRLARLPARVTPRLSCDPNDNSSRRTLQFSSSITAASFL